MLSSWISKEERFSRDIGRKFRRCGMSLTASREYEQSINYAVCLRISRSANAQQMQLKIPSSDRATFYARYGDFLAATCNELFNEAEAKKTEG